MANKKRQRRKLPEVKDPYDMSAKAAINPNADKLNFIDDRGRLVCGAKKKRGPGKCRSPAGSGTAHRGHGRCKHCGGASIGPKTQEGKDAVSQNAKKHGFYSKVLTSAERETYEDLIQDKLVSLEHEIYMLKAKIVSYLQQWREKYDAAMSVSLKDAEDTRSPEERAMAAVRIYCTTGLDQERAYYHAGTADDKVLTRQLDLLRRLVDSQSKLTPQSGQGLLDTINQELRAASHGKVSMEWGGRQAQSRTQKQDQASEEDA